MTPRHRFTAQERNARSRLAQLLHEQDVIRGSLVPMARRCGKAGCHCVDGDKHVSLYLAVKIKGKRRMVYIPADMEEQARQAVSAWQQADALAHAVSAACVARVLERKKERGSER